MKWIIPTRSMVGEYGHARRGVPMEVEDEIADKLVKAGRAVADPNKGKAAPEKKAGKATGDSAGNPSKPRRSGGRTGAGKSSSVSEAGQAPGSQTSSSSGAPGQG